MYTSFYAGSTVALSQRSKHHRKNQPVVPPSANELRDGGLGPQPVFHTHQKIMNNRIEIKKIINDTSFVVYHKDFRKEFLLKQVADTEKIDKWIEMQTHSNLITAFDLFHEPESNKYFQMVELNNAGNMYQFIEDKKLDLSLDIPRDYIELVFDVGIQLATGLDFAHNAGLYHGQLDLSKVQVHKVHDQNNVFEFKITDFTPESSLEIPLSEEASYWPFKKNKKNISEKERIEVLMLKDVYTLGICLLEVMIGRHSKKGCAISLDSLPMTWAEYPESTPILQVLVECIQIDSITQRKGKLQHIRKLLINEYKKYFKKQFYKMETPFVGKKADVLNKKAIVSLFHRREEKEKRVELWTQAKQINDTHYDSTCNELMFYWSNAQIDDQELMEKMQNFIFDQQIGLTLKGYLLIAFGERDEGMKFLKEFIEHYEKDKTTKNKVLNASQEARDVLQVIQDEKTSHLFLQNSSTVHQHKGVVQHLAFGPGSKSLVSTTSDEIKVWNVDGTALSLVCTIQFEDSKKSDQISSVNYDATKVIVHQGSLIFNAYQIQDGRATKQDTIDLQKQIKSQGNPGFLLNQGDRVTDMKFMDEKSEVLRIYLSKGKDFYTIDLQLIDQNPKLRKSIQYDDISVNNLQVSDKSNATSLQENLKKFISEEAKFDSVIQFPETDHNTVAVLRRKEQTKKVIMIFDIKRNCFCRIKRKRFMESEAFALDKSGRLLVVSDLDELKIELIKIPHSQIFIDCLRPRVKLAEHKMQPALASQKKNDFKDRVYKQLHFYHMFKADKLKAEKHSGLTEEINMLLMVLKYHEAVENPTLMKSNKEFQMMQKILLEESDVDRSDSKRVNLLKDTKLNTVKNLKRIEIYDDELTYLNRNSKIDFVELASEPNLHFFLVAMDGIIFKYDLVTKGLIFSFKSQATKAMKLYGNDDKLLVASESQISLWDFDHYKQVIPEIFSQLDLKKPVKGKFEIEDANKEPHEKHPFKIDKIEHVYINKKHKNKSPLTQSNEKNQDENTKSQPPILVTQQDKYVLYCGRLQRKFKPQSVKEKHNALITFAAFNEDSTKIWLGLSTGKMIEVKYSDNFAQETGLEVVFAENQPITYIERFMGNDDDQEFYLVHVQCQKAYIWNAKQNEQKEIKFDDPKYESWKITKAKVAKNGKFFVLGILNPKTVDYQQSPPEDRAIVFFSFDAENFTMKQDYSSKKYPFKYFFVDDLFTQMMMLDQEQKTLDYQFIVWDFDRQIIDEKKKKWQNIDSGKIQLEENYEIPSDIDEEAELKKLAQMQKQTTCCTIF